MHFQLSALWLYEKNTKTDDNEQDNNDESFEEIAWMNEISNDCGYNVSIFQTYKTNGSIAYKLQIPVTKLKDLNGTYYCSLQDDYSNEVAVKAFQIDSVKTGIFLCILLN